MVVNSKVIFFFLLCYLFNGISGIPPQYINVTLAVFSGRPDPQWLLLPTNPNFAEIKRLLDEARNGQQTYDSILMPPRLGYKGFLIQDETQKVSQLVIGPKTVDLQKKMFETLSKDWLQGKYLEKFFIQMKDEINSGKITALTKEQLQKLQEQVPQQQQKQADRQKRHAYPYAPNYWNNDDNRRLNNNCYNYANNKATDTYAQPGRGSGSILTGYWSNSVRNAAVNDHLDLVLNNIPPAPPGGIIPPNGNQHLVYLVVNGGLDFHWLRLDDNGYWSHKMGQATASNLDNNNAVIIDPRTAFLAGYMNGVFLESNKDDVTVA